MRGFSLPPRRLNIQSPGGNQSPSIPNLFQRYPIYLTLHKILDGTYLVEELKKHKQIQEIEKAENEKFEDNNLYKCTLKS